MPTKFPDTPLSGLSYYGLLLLSYLLDSHPDLINDMELIRSRANSAANAYCQVIRNGGSRTEADDQATQVLYQGLHFSLYTTLVQILWDEFPEIVPEDKARQTALKLLPQVSSLKQRYDLTDDFVASPNYDLFYTELVGMIQNLLDHGLQ